MYKTGNALVKESVANDVMSLFAYDKIM